MKKMVTEIRAAIPDFDLKQELECLRKEGFNLRSWDNRNPDLDTGEEMRSGRLYLAVGTDMEWLACPRLGVPREAEYSKYKNNAANRIFLVDLAWQVVRSYLENIPENTPVADYVDMAEFFARRSEFCGIKLV